MKTINIRPYHEEYRDCTEDAIASIIISREKNCELMYLRPWFFKYSGASLIESDSLSANIIIEDYEDWFNNLRRYYGIELEYIQDNNENFLDIVKYEISENRPVVVNVDGFWIKWCAGYQKYHLGHSLIINGFDDESQELCLCDPYYEKNEMLSIDEFIRAFENKYTKFIFNKKLIKEFCIEDLDIVTKKIISDSKRAFHSNDSIMEFADLIEEKLDLKHEFPSTFNIWGYPLHRKMSRTAQLIMQFAMVLKYIGEKENKDYLFLITEKLSELSESWVDIVAIMTKAALKGMDSSVRHKMANKIRNIVDKQNMIAELILNKNNSFE